MNPGKLNRRVLIEVPGTTQDSFGQLTTGWVTLANAWAQITPKTGRELITAKSVASEVTCTITVRNNPAITAACRITHNGKVYNILAVINRNDANTFLELDCSEGLNNG